jgi:hypothetical protein
LFIQRHRDGLISWLGDGYCFGGSAEKSEKYPKGKYNEL